MAVGSLGTKGCVSRSSFIAIFPSAVQMSTPSSALIMRVICLASDWGVGSASTGGRGGGAGAREAQRQSVDEVGRYMSWDVCDIWAGTNL